MVIKVFQAQSNSQLLLMYLSDSFFFCCCSNISLEHCLKAFLHLSYISASFLSTLFLSSSHSSSVIHWSDSFFVYPSFLCIMQEVLKGGFAVLFLFSLLRSHLAGFMQCKCYAAHAPAFSAVGLQEVLCVLRLCTLNPHANDDQKAISPV